MDKCSRSYIRFEIIFLILIVLATFSIRFYNTGELSNGDDSEYAQLAMHIIEKPVRAIYPSFPDEPMSYENVKYNRPLAATPIVPFIFIFGYTNTAVKLPSIIFACLSVVLLFYILKKHFNPRIAYIASLLFTFSPFHILFSRAGFLHSSLVFYILLTILLIDRYFETRKHIYVYLASLACLANLLTTDFRGVLPLISLVPYVIVRCYAKIKAEQKINAEQKEQKEPWKGINNALIMKVMKEIRHFVFAGIMLIVIYIGYMLIPLLLWNDPSWLGWLKLIFIHSTGLSHAYHGYKSFTENILLMGRYLIMTPFIGLIFVPMLFGIIKSIKELFSSVGKEEKTETIDGTKKAVKKEVYLFWICYMATFVLYYINKQPYFERQMVFTPAFVTFAAIGVYWTYERLSEGKPLIFSFLFLATSIYMISLLKLFPTLFGMSSAGNPENASLIINIITFAADNFLLIALLIILVWICMYAFLKYVCNPIKGDFRTRRQRACKIKNNIKNSGKNIGKLTIAGFILVNIICSSFLVASGISVYKRPDAVKKIADFLKANTDGVKYAALAYNEDKAITYYTQKICANYKKVNVTWIENQVKLGNLKYFVINTYQQKVGIGLETWANLEKYYPEQYAWMMENTVDVTEQTGLSPDNPYYRIRLAKNNIN